MKRRICFGFAIFHFVVGGGCGGSSEDFDFNPFLWQTEGEGSAYLLGTIHVGGQAIDDLFADLTEFVDASDQVFTEIPLEAAVEEKILELSVLPDGQKLEDVLEPDLYNRLNAFLQSKKIPIYVIEQYKIWVVEQMLPVLISITSESQNPNGGGGSGKTLDQQVYEYAKKVGKSVGGLETVEEQIDIFDGLTLEEQALSLERTLDALESEDYDPNALMQLLLDIYLTGDEIAMAKAGVEVYNEDDPLEAKLKDRLFTQRNQRMAQRMGEYMQEATDQTFFFAVGVGHLVSSGSVNEILQNMGWRVVRYVGHKQEIHKLALALGESFFFIPRVVPVSIRKHIQKGELMH